jgi:HAD superfamily (subfamily IIIA) phosphatase
MKIYRPDIYQKDIFSINYKNLKNKKIKVLIYDIDDTLIPSNEIKLKKETINLITKLKKDFKIILLTNSPSFRSNKIKNQLDVDCYSLSMKPLKYNLNKIMKNYDKKDVVLIGDRLLTDIKLANNYNIMSILVDPITNHNFILVKIMKILKEEPLYKELEKQNILIRGRYYG